MYDEVPPEAHQEENYGYDTGSNSAVPDERDIITKDQKVDGYCENKQLAKQQVDVATDQILSADESYRGIFLPERRIVSRR